MFKMKHFSVVSSYVLFMIITVRLICSLVLKLLLKIISFITIFLGRLNFNQYFFAGLQSEIAFNIRFAVSPF